MNEFGFIALGLILGLTVGAVSIYFIQNYRNAVKNKKNKETAENILANTNTKAEALILNAKTQVKEMIDEANLDIKSRKQEIISLERKLEQKETLLDKKDELLFTKEAEVTAKLKDAEQRLRNIEKEEAILEKKKSNYDEELAKIAQLPISEAKSLLMKEVEEKSKEKIAILLRAKAEEYNLKAREMAQDILSLAISKYSQDTVSERTTATVLLPSDELKGRIIGREGRNIRSIEQLTGVDLLIDDTPEIITISCFDPIKKEIAKRTLESLIKDGRIQPGRIEEIVEKSKAEVKDAIMKAGEETAFELGINRVDKNILELIGKLKFRYSYGQNALQHSKEVAYFAGIMASELGLDINIARRAGLLHDIGKALTAEKDGGDHVALGVEVAKKYGENAIILNAIASHHGGVEATSPYAVLVAASDTLSAARPGARSDTIENYIKRIQKLEEIAYGFEGVSKVDAIQAGREIRIMVYPEKVDDIGMIKIAEDIKDKIEKDMAAFPGQIKITIIRESRTNVTAK